MESIEKLQEPRPTFLNLDREKRNRIVLAAVDEFSVHGFKSASMNALVRTIGISKGSIFQYFTNKEGLFLYVIQHAVDLVKRYLKRVRTETADQEVFERIKGSMMAGVTFVQKHPKIFELYLRLMFESDIPFRSELIQSIRRLSIEYLTGLLQTGKERGEIDGSVDVHKAAFFLDSILDRCLQAYGMQHVDVGLGLFGASYEEAEAWASQVTEFCRRGLAANGETDKEHQAVAHDHGDYESQAHHRCGR